LSAPTDIAVASFSAACGGGTCIPQAGTSQLLDSLGDRLMYRLAYRNFGDHDALVFNQSVAAGSSVGLRWYELRSPLAGAFTVYQQGTFAPDSTYRWMGSAAMDQVGDIAVGYSASSSSLFPAIRYTGRTPSDALGTMRAETSLLAGAGSQTGGLNRWGDYTACASIRATTAPSGIQTSTSQATAHSIGPLSSAVSSSATAARRRRTSRSPRRPLRRLWFRAILPVTPRR